MKSFGHTIRISSHILIVRAMQESKILSSHLNHLNMFLREYFEPIIVSSTLISSLCLLLLLPSLSPDPVLHQLESSFKVVATQRSELFGMLVPPEFSKPFELRCDFIVHRISHIYIVMTISFVVKLGIANTYLEGK
jgi:hypothetical protein